MHTAAPSLSQQTSSGSLPYPINMICSSILKRLGTVKETTIMAEEILSESMRETLVQRLRELQPWMKIDVVHSLASKCSKLLEDGVKEQEQVIEESKARTNFLSLSPELRNRIYELVLIPQDLDETGYERGHRTENRAAIRLGYHYNYSQGATASQNAWALQPALTKVCRLIRKETLSVYYGANEFVTEADDRKTHPPWVNEIRFPHALRWLRAIGPENRRLLRTLTIRGGCLATRWVSARRFLAVMAKEGIDVPEDIVASFHQVDNANEFGRSQISWVKATPEQEEEHSNFGNEPDVWSETHLA